MGRWIICRSWGRKPCAIHLSVLPVGVKNSQRNLELSEVCEDSNRPTQTPNDRGVVSERDKKQEKRVEKHKPERKVTQKRI